MALSVRELHDRIVAQLGDLEGWNKSRVGHDLFGRDARELAHHAWAVAVPKSVPTSVPERQRARGQETTRATVATSTLSIRWSRQLRAADRDGDLASGYDDELVLVDAVLDLDIARDLGIRWTGAERVEVPGYLVGRLTFEVLHRMPLEV